MFCEMADDGDDPWAGKTFDHSIGKAGPLDPNGDRLAESD